MCLAKAFRSNAARHSKSRCTSPRGLGDDYPNAYSRWYQQPHEAVVLSTFATSSPSGVKRAFMSVSAFLICPMKRSDLVLSQDFFEDTWKNVRASSAIIYCQAHPFQPWDLRKPEHAKPHAQA